MESSLIEDLPSAGSPLISRAADENRPRRRRLGFGGSLVVHALAALLFVILAALFPKPQSETQSTSREIVTITHRTRRPEAAAPPRAAAVVRPLAKPRPARIARSAAPPRAPHVFTPPVRAVAPRIAAAAAVPQVVRHRAAPAPVAAAPQAAAVARPGRAARPALSKAHIDDIEHDLAQSIAEQRNGITPLAVGTSEPAPSMKRYGPAIAAFDVGDERSHHGLCDPIKEWNAEGYDYYYVACNVRFSDGTMQRESVPWPVRFQPGDDPFSGTAGKDLPLAMPLPGWHPDTGTYISKELREYAHDHGVTI